MALLTAVAVAGLACLVIRGMPGLRQCVSERKAERRGDILFQRGRVGAAEELWAGILKGNANLIADSGKQFHFLNVKFPRLTHSRAKRAYDPASGSHGYNELSLEILLPY